MQRYAELTKQRLLNIKAAVGETSVPTALVFLNEDGTAHDISGYDFELIVKKSPRATTNTFKLTIGSGLTVEDSNRLIIEVSEVQADVQADVYFWRLYSTYENHTWLNGDWEFINGKYDGVTDTETITIAENGTPVTVTVSTQTDQFVAINTQTDDYVLQLTDNFNLVNTNKWTPNSVTIPPYNTVPFEIGSQIIVNQYGAGQTTIQAGSGVTLRSPGGALKISAQYSGCVATKIDTNEWLVQGDLEV